VFVVIVTHPVAQENEVVVVVAAKIQPCWVGQFHVIFFYLYLHQIVLLAIYLH